MFSGDGDIVAIGGNHFIHAARRNADLLIICINKLQLRDDRWAEWTDYAHTRSHHHDALTIVRSAAQLGADVLVTSCPLCQFNLDWQQVQIAESNGEVKSVPVLYFTQLMALALGAEPYSLGLEHHLVDPRPVLLGMG